MINLLSPYISPSFSVIIKNPELKDNVIVDLRTMFKKGMDGSTYGYKKTPAHKKHTLVFKHLSRRKILEVLLFLQNASTYDIRYVDRLGQTWQGLITNYPVEAVTTGTGQGIEGERKEDNEITLQFEGVLKFSITVLNELGQPVRNENGDLVITELP